jgi:hypothetical protein
MISKIKTIKAVMAKCRGIVKIANGNAATARRPLNRAISKACLEAILPTFSGDPPRVTPSTNILVDEFRRALPVSYRNEFQALSGCIDRLSRVCRPALKHPMTDGQPSLTLQKR